MGLPRHACRLHAYLYLKAVPTKPSDAQNILDLQVPDIDTALAFLTDYKLAWSHDGVHYQTHLDPWEAMMNGLDQRRGRDLPIMKSTLADLYNQLTPLAGIEARQIEKMIKLVDDLSAIHAQAFRASPRFLRGVIGLSGRAARFIGGGKQ